MADLIVTVFGGTGFVGRRVVERLLAHGFTARIASRGGDAQRRLFSGHGERVQTVTADVTDDLSVATATEGAFGAVNAVSLYVEKHGTTFRDIHVDAAARLARRARAAGLRRLVLMSGIGADPHSDSPYIRSRGEGEEAVREAFPRATVMRPAVMFGKNDSFVVSLTGMLRRAPVFPLFGSGQTRLQPACADDVAEAIALSFTLPRPGPLYELGGPRVYAYRELVGLLARHVGSRAALVPVPFALWRGLGAACELLPRPPLARNHVELMMIDTVVAAAAAGFAELGIQPRSLEDMLPEIVPPR